MLKKINIIEEAVMKAVLKEAEKSKTATPEKCDKIIGEIRNKLIELNSNFAEMGIDTTCDPYKKIKQMNHILASYDPVEVNMAQYFKPKTQVAAENMVEGDMVGDVKIPTNSAKDKENKAVEMSKKYGADIELTD